jgi:hypothetical protein
MLVPVGRAGRSAAFAGYRDLRPVARLRPALVGVWSEHGSVRLTVDVLGGFS